MATVQEPMERAENAVAAMLREGLPITGRGIVAYLKRTEGIGCSLREAMVAARAYREAQAPKWGRAVQRVRATLEPATKGLPADAVLRAGAALRSVDWIGEAEALIRGRKEKP
jgi:hypothetical protein